MRLGINLPFARPDGTAPTAAEVMARARLIERVGFEGIWFGETIGRARPPVPMSWRGCSSQLQRPNASNSERQLCRCHCDTRSSWLSG